MKFSVEDQQNLQSLRITLHPKCDPTAIELADAFNADMDGFEERLNSFFDPPSIDAMVVEFDDLKAIRDTRDMETLQVLKDLVSIHSLRSGFHGKIQDCLNAASKAARENCEAVTNNVKATLTPHYKERAKLDDAVKNTAAVKEAHELFLFHRDQVAEINKNANISGETVSRLEKQYFVVLTNWVNAFLERRTREVDPRLAQVEERNERMLASIERSKSQRGNGSASVQLDRDEPSKADGAT